MGQKQICSRQKTFLVGSKTQNVRYSDPQMYFFFRADKVVNDDDYDKKRSKAAIRAQALKEMQNEKEVSHYIG